jgi:RNA polymerase primary sigma factor
MSAETRFARPSRRSELASAEMQHPAALLAHVDHRARECRGRLRRLVRRRDGLTAQDRDAEREGLRRETTDLLSELARLRVVAALARDSSAGMPGGSDGYLVGRGDRPAMPRAAERALVTAAKQGDAVARAELIEAFLPLISTVARLYRRSAMVDRAELMQEGVAGLLSALQRFEPDRDTPFWAYAGWWVRQAMQHLTAELTGPVVLSDRALRQLARVRDARRSYQQTHGSDPSTESLASAIGLTSQEVERLLAVELMPRALDEPLSGDGRPRGGHVLADPGSEDAYERVLREAEIDGIRPYFDDLDDRERAILRARYGLEGEAQTLREIAGGLGISAERVRQIEQRALEELRTAAGHAG